MRRLALGLMLAALLVAPAAGDGRPIHSHMNPALPKPAARPPFDFAATYTADLWSNTRGGRARGVRYLDNLDLTLTVDAGAAFGWQGATLFVYALYNNGRSLSGDLVGDLQTASNIDTGGVQALRLYEAWVEQRLAGDRLSLKLGLFDLNSEFDTNDSSAIFINSSFGVGPDFSQSGRNGPSIFPVTSLAVRAQYQLTEHWRVRAAVLAGTPGDPAHPRRTAILLRPRDGVLLVGEAAYQDADTQAAIGSWHYTARFDDLLASAQAGQPVQHGGNSGVYAYFERRLTHPGPSTGLSGFIRVGIADQQANPFGSYIGGGLVYAGPLPGRAADHLGLAVASVALADRFRRAQALTGEPTTARETTIELTYRAPLTPRLTVQPDVQYIIHPGADPRVRDALVVGLRAEVGF